MILEITLIRNGSTQWGKEGRLSGDPNAPLCREGVCEIEKRVRAKVYPSVSRVYTGASQRCLDTTSLIYRLPALVAEGFCGFDYGGLTGKAYGELVGDKQFQLWAAAEWAAPMAGGKAPQLAESNNLQEFRTIVSEMEGFEICRAAVITHKVAILLILNKFIVPKIPYASAEIRHGGGCTILYDTGSSSLKIKNTF